MKYIFIFISAFCYLSNLNSQDILPVYNDGDIDLSTYKIASLYKGKERKFIASGLDAEGVYDLVKREKNLWHLVLEFHSSKKSNEEKDIWMQFRTNVNAASIYINNNLFLQNGIINHSSPVKIVGKNLIKKRIPKTFLVEGVNTIGITFSNYKDLKGAIFRDISIGSLESFQKHMAIMSMAPILFSGIFMFTLFINLILYFSLNRKKVFIILAILFLINSLLVVYEVLYWNGMVAATSFIHNFTLRGILEYLTYFILLFVLYFEFEFNKRHLLYSICAFFLTYLLAVFTKTSIAIALSFIPFSFSFFALIKKMKNSILITISLFLLFLFNLIDDYNFIEDFDFVYSNYMITSIVYKLDNLGMVIFALIMIFTSAKGILSKTNALNEAKLKLERLEYQFLQKHIQPHFLMNSLMSLQQLVPKDPENASKMIEALSNEFHLLTKMSKKKYVPLIQEIEMCQTHLKIMSIQQRAHYKMEVSGLDGNEMIPPATIHTLVENGITHGYSGNENACFKLRKEVTAYGVKYCLFNDGKTDITLKNNPANGTGLKYVKARLEECYPGKWKLYSNSVINGWEAIIEINENV